MMRDVELHPNLGALFQYGSMEQGKVRVCSRYGTTRNTSYMPRYVGFASGRTLEPHCSFASGGPPGTAMPGQCRPMLPIRDSLHVGAPAFGTKSRQDLPTFPSFHGHTSCSLSFTVPPSPSPTILPPAMSPSNNHTSPLDSSTKKPWRRQHRKSRNGCATCKARRVKV
jgi:hypothetical protein